MNSKAGVVTSQVAWLGAAPLAAVDLKGAAVGFFIAGVCSYLPDLDHDGSTAGRAVGGGAKVIRKVSGGHRMGTHSLLAVVLMWLLVGYLTGTPVYATAAAVGWASHIFCDVLTIQGTALFYPLTRKKFHIGWMITGHRGEEVYVRLVQCFGVILLLFYLAQLSGGTA